MNIITTTCYINRYSLPVILTGSAGEDNWFQLVMLLMKINKLIKKITLNTIMALNAHHTAEVQCLNILKI